MYKSVTLLMMLILVCHGRPQQSRRNRNQGGGRGQMGGAGDLSLTAQEPGMGNMGGGGFKNGRQGGGGGLSKFYGNGVADAFAYGALTDFNGRSGGVGAGGFGAHSKLHYRYHQMG